MLMQKFIDVCNSYLGVKAGTPRHNEIVTMYNGIVPLPQKYVLKVNDNWCAAFLSACAWKASAGDPNAFPYECGCERMVNLLKGRKELVEDESVKPKVGWLVFYDWKDNGKGDNKGWSDHVGLVVYVGKTSFTVIEGNKQSKVATREVKFNDKGLRAFGAIKYDTIPKKKSVTEVAHEVIKGVYGNGNRRKMLLTNLGYDPVEVQKEVNKILSKK